MSFRKAATQEFNCQLKEIKTQLQDQLKCLEQRTDTQLGIYHEIQDFCKRRAEIDQDYARQLEKLAKSAMIRFKSEKTKRANWSIYSACNLLMQLVDDTKDEARHRLTIAEVLGNYSNASFNSHSNHLQKVSKKVKEIGVLAQGEVVRVIDEMNVSMKTYQQCFEQCETLNEKVKELEVKLQPEDLSTRKRRSIQKNLLKATSKFETSKKKCDRARNEYLLCVDAANASLHKYFADDLVDVIGCMDVGTDYWTCLLLDNIIASRKVACQSEMNALAQLSSAVSMMPQCDKQRFFESHNNTFMLPKRFEFKADQRESINELTVEGAGGDLDQRRHQMNVRLQGLRTESQHMRQTLLQAEQRIHTILAAQHALEITNDGIVDNRPQPEALESELEQAVEAYTTAFNFFVLNANLIARLEARADGIAVALGHMPDSSRTHGTEQWGNGSVRGSLQHQQSAGAYSSPQTGRRSINSSHPQLPTQDSVAAVAAALRLQGQGSPRGGYDNRSNYSAASGNQGLGSALATPTAGSSLNTSTNSTRSGTQYGQTTPHFTAHPQFRRPRLFGGSLEEYVQATGEKIPTIVTSCIRALSQFAAHHQGVFRVSGSHSEINNLKDAFEEGYNPLENLCDAKDANCIAGLLTKYLRELRDPLFPFFLFERILDCAKTSNPDEFITKISDLIRKLPMSSYLLLRYLFAFLHYVSENSSGNMMNSYNLAVCFGPTLLRVPNSKDQVYYQNFVNEAIKKIIIHHEKIFSANIPGPIFQKPTSIDQVHHYADEASTSYTSMTPSNSNSGTVASSTLQNNDGRSILGDEPIQSASTTARNSISSRIQSNSSPVKVEGNVGSNANYYSSSAESSTHNLNGHPREPQQNGKSPVLARLSSNDENEHRLNMSNASLNDSATAFRRLCVKDENIVQTLESPKFPVKLAQTSPPLTADSHKPEIHAKTSSNYLIRNAPMNGTNGINGNVKTGGDPIRTLERIRIPVAPKPNNSSSASSERSPPSVGSNTMPTGTQGSLLVNAVQASINARNQSPTNSYVYSTVNKVPRQNSAPIQNHSSILNTMNKLDELVAENRLISAKANIIGQHYLPATTNNSVPSKTQ